MSVDQYCYLWDGSQPGWELLCFHGTRITLTVKFAIDGPSPREFIAARKVIPDLKTLPLSVVIQRLKGLQFLQLGEFESKEARNISQACTKGGLTVIEQSNELPRYLLRNCLSGRALLIEDGELARQVVDTALLNQIPVQHVEA